MKAAITATAKYVPTDVLTNFDLEKIIDTNDEWIRTRTGISERRILKDPTKATAFMCAEVSKQILEKRGIGADEIDLILVATVTPDMVFPATGCLVQDMIGAKKAWGFDISAACSGFLYALTIGAQFIESGMHKKVL
ncbi:MAG: 3-oxoacyl-ACP synthase, partial [Chlorobiales bacterium]|nr:3-oxoacyl-ACP synthase [Chlorobiales bacterium]